MGSKLHKALNTQRKKTQQKEQVVYGSLGIPLGGRKLVQVPDRNSFVYVRLRDNQNEVVQAFNNKVAASYDLPVIIHREGTRYIVDGVNTERYQSNWNNFAPYLPLHGQTHSFVDGGGGDVAWVFSRQIMPYLVYPDDVYTGTTLKVYQHTLLNNNAWKVVGGTGTPNLLQYLPTGGNDAIMGLLYLDAPSGNPYLTFNSGTPFSNLLTGTNDIYSYIPVPNLATQIPLAAIRLASGTSAINWNNIYDVRQWVHTQSSGTSSGGGGSSSSYDNFWNSGTAGAYAVRAKNDTSTDAVMDYAMAMGQNTYASGTAAFAEGNATQAIGQQAHAEGRLSEARGSRSHSEGFSTKAYGADSHAEGNSTIASGSASFAGGVSNHAIGTQSAVLAGTGNRVEGQRSVILGGQNISGAYNDTVFVPYLDVRFLSSGTSITNLGIRSDGMLVSGTSGGGSTFAGVDQIGVYGQSAGVPLGTGTVFNVNGSRLAFSISGTVLNLTNSPDPVDNIGIYGMSGTVGIATGTTLSVGLGLSIQATGTVLYLSNSYRENLTADRTYFVRTNGSDSNNGLANTAAGAFLTLQKAIDAASALDSVTYNVTIQLSSGTYSTTTGNTLKSMVGAGTITILGDATTPANVTLSTSGNNANVILGDNVSTLYTINGIKFTSTGTNPVAIAAKGTTNITIKNINFNTGYYAHINPSYGGTIQGTAYTVAAGATYHWLLQIGGKIVFTGITITVSGTSNFTGAFLYESEVSLAYIASNTYSGSATGKRYDLNSNSVAQSGATTLPGNVAGTTATGAQYL